MWPGPLGGDQSATVFYLLRQYQKIDRDPSWEDFERFLQTLFIRCWNFVSRGDRTGRSGSVTWMRVSCRAGDVAVGIGAGSDCCARYRFGQMDAGPTAADRQRQTGICDLSCNGTTEDASARR